jgi:hypothetical protein
VSPRVTTDATVRAACVLSAPPGLLCPCFPPVREETRRGHCNAFTRSVQPNKPRPTAKHTSPLVSQLCRLELWIVTRATSTMSSLVTYVAEGVVTQVRSCRLGDRTGSEGRPGGQPERSTAKVWGQYRGYLESHSGEQCLHGERVGGGQRAQHGSGLELLISNDSKGDAPSESAIPRALVGALVQRVYVRAWGA